MTFSIIIPAHNSAKYIRKALNSVKAQTCDDYELIVVCDDCTDNTAEIARRYTDKVYEVPFHNEGKARNYGLDHAEGDWIMWIDDDDWWLHEYVLEEINKRLTDNIDALCFSFVFKGRGCVKPQNTAGHWIAVWTKCWRRSFIGGTRFEEEFPSDVTFHRRMMAKSPRLKDVDMLMYYYNYMRPYSATWLVSQGRKPNQ